MDVFSEQRRLDYYKTRFKRAKAVADLWIALLNRAYDYAVPNRNLFYWTSQTQGSQKNAKVYDTTAVAGTRNLVSKLQSALTPPGQRWALLKAGTEIPEDQAQEINEYLQDVTDRLFDFLHHSNFDVAINESYYDLAIGTGILCVNEGETDEEPFRFYSVPLSRVAMEESHNNVIESVYRWWDEISIADVMARWPNAIITPTMQAMYDVDPTSVIKNLVEATVFHPERDTEPFSYCIWYNEELLLEEMSDSSPWIVFRWAKINNEIYGRGPVIEALPSILSLNEIARIELAAANFNLCKPYMAYSDSVFQPWTFNMQPNTVIQVAPISNGQWPIQPMPDVVNPAFGQLVITDLRMQINDMLYNQPLGPVDSPTRTATEVAVRQKSFAEIVGPGLTRLQSEFLPRLINRLLYILKKRGLIKPFVVNGREVQLTYQSPLTYAQGQQDVQTMQGVMQVLQGIYGPEDAVIYIDNTKLPIWVAEKLGADLSVFNSEAVMKEKMAGLQEQQQQMQQLQMQQAQQQAQGAV